VDSSKSYCFGCRLPSSELCSTGEWIQVKHIVLVADHLQANYVQLRECIQVNYIYFNWELHSSESCSAGRVYSSKSYCFGWRLPSSESGSTGECIQVNYIVIVADCLRGNHILLGSVFK
jgi:hypothetical protein